MLYDAQRDGRMTYNAELLLQALIETSEKYPFLPGLCYRSPHDFVAQHGREYLPVPFRGRKGVQRICFGNAIAWAGKYGYRYVEGFALAPTGEVILHGWNAKPDGSLHDSTWMNTGLAYIGVEFSVERADDATWNGDALVLNDENRNYPVFQKRWEGEDYAIQWPYSDRLDVLRNGGGLPASVVEFENKEKPG